MEKEKKNSGKKWGLWLVSLVAMLLVFLLGRGSSRAQGMVDYTLLSRLEEQGVERAASAVFSAESSRRKVIEDQVAASLSREAHLLEFRADISRHAASLEQSIAESIESSLLQSIAESQYLAEAERALRAESVRREALDASKALAESSRLAEAESSRQAAEEAASRLAAAEASRQAAEESSRQAAAEASRQAAEEAARQAAEEASRQAAAEASGKAAEEASRWAAAEASRKAAEEASRQAAAEASRKASEEAAKQTVAPATAAPTTAAPATAAPTTAAPTTAAPTTAQAISGGETVLIGDSRTQGISYLSVWPLHLIFYTWNPIIQAPELAEKAAARFPAKAVFLNGIDDIITYGNDGAVRIYEDYIVRFSQMSPGTAIYVGSVLPILDHALVRYPQLNNLEGYNVLLQQMCARHGWTYVDGSAGFPGQAAFYEGGDGIHFHPNWTRQWFNNLRQLVGF